LGGDTRVRVVEGGKGGKVESNVDSFFCFWSGIVGKSFGHVDSTHCNSLQHLQHSASHCITQESRFGEWWVFKDFEFVGVVSHMNESCHI